MDVAFAIADAVRRDILILLRDGVMSAGEIAGCFDISRPAVSRHLRVLRECGLVVDEVRGRERLYRLDTAPLAPLEAWLAEVHDRWSAPLDALDARSNAGRRVHQSDRPDRTVLWTRNWRGRLPTERLAPAAQELFEARAQPAAERQPLSRIEDHTEVGVGNDASDARCIDNDRAVHAHELPVIQLLQ